MKRPGDQVRVAVIGEAAGELTDDPTAWFSLSQQQPTAISRDRPAVKLRHHIASPQAVEIKRKLVTVCLHQVGLRRWHKVLSKSLSE